MLTYFQIINILKHLYTKHQHLACLTIKTVIKHDNLTHISDKYGKIVKSFSQNTYGTQVA